MSDKPDTLTVPGIPPLTWERKFGWRCDVNLPEWPGEGAIRMSFDCPDIYARTPPTAAQVAAAVGVLTGGFPRRDAILRAVFDELQGWMTPAEAVRYFGAALTDPGQLESTVVLNTVGIIDVADDFDAEANYEFDCPWDPEHGFIASVAADQVTYVGPM